MAKKWHIFLINPAAGPKDCRKELEANAERYFQESNDSKFLFFSSSKRGEIEELARIFTEATGRDGRNLLLYACGGDGTLNEAVNGIMQVKNRDHVSITHIPRGSGNDFIKSFSNPEAFSDISLFSDDKNIRDFDIDLIKANNRYCINICSFGFDARVGTSIDKFRRSVWFPEKYAYIASAASNIFKGIKRHMIIEIETTDGEDVYLEGDFTLVCFCNGSWYGGGFHPIPEAELNDGVINSLIIKETNKFKVAALIKKYSEGKYRELGNYAHRYDIRRAKIITNDLEPVNVDGELLMSRDTSIEIIPKALKFFAPKSTWIE